MAPFTLTLKASDTGLSSNLLKKEKRRDEEAASKKKEEAAVELAIRKLYLDNKRILDSIGDIEKQEYDLLVEKPECIFALAENFEKLHELGDYKEPIDYICSTIVSLVRDTRGFFATESWIHNILPARYKEPMAMFRIPEPLSLDYLSCWFDSASKERKRYFEGTT